MQSTNITWYEDWMRPQVASLFEGEYKIPAGKFANLFEEFYMSPFQKDKSLLIVALCGEKVAGFQSFFYWPYQKDGVIYNSYQSGNSLVHPEFRGQGLFQRMLKFVHENNSVKQIDFLIGFPVEASLKSFLKDKWNNPLNLRWYVKPVNPFGFFKTAFKGKNEIRNGLHYVQEVTSKSFRLVQDNKFTEWRNSYLNQKDYFTFFYKGEKDLLIQFKLQNRKKILKELVIGNILFSEKHDPALLKKALNDLSAAARSSFGVNFISCAVNEKCSLNDVSGLEAAGYKRTERSIYFITKPLTDLQDVNSPKEWRLYRSDIDTW